MFTIDEGSDAFFASLVDAVVGTRNLLVVNFRPEYRARWMQKGYYRYLPLEPLGPQAIADLLEDLLGAGPDMSGLADLVRKRTGGNPFFVEEVVHSLVEAGHLSGVRGAYRLAAPVDHMAIPSTVEAVLAARIDRLSPQEKEVLQIASVIGKTFSEAVLQRVVDAPEDELAEALRGLLEAEFLYRESLSPDADYTFRHPLTQEVAYRSQLSDRRSRVHAAVAQAITSGYADKLDERAALLAYHWEEAGEALAAAQWHGRAAGWAAGVHAAGAVDHLRKVLGLLERAPRASDATALGLEACVDILRVGPFVSVSENEAAEILEKGRQLAQRDGDQRALARLVSTYGYFKGTVGDFRAARAYAQEAGLLADRAGDPGLKVALGLDHAQACLWAGGLREGLDLTEEVLKTVPAGRELLGISVGLGGEIFPVALRGLFLAFMGHCQEAAGDLERTLELARQRSLPEGLCVAHCFRAIVANAVGDGESMLGHSRAAVEIAERLGTPFLQVTSQLTLGIAHALVGEWDRARQLLEQVLAASRLLPTTLVQQAMAFPWLALAHLGAGDLERARTVAEEGIGATQRRGARLAECMAQAALARVLMATDGAKSTDAVEAALQRAAALVEATGAAIYEPPILEARAELARLHGDEPTRKRNLREAHRLFAEMGATRHAERVARELGERDDHPGR